MFIILFLGNCHVPPVVRSQQWKLLKCTNKSRCPACWLKLCLKAFQVPPHIRATLTAMLPSYMRSGSKPSGSLAQTHPLRIVSNNSSTTQSTFSSLVPESDNNIFAIKATKKPDEVEKIEVRNFFLSFFLNFFPDFFPELFCYITNHLKCFFFNV